MRSVCDYCSAELASNWNLLRHIRKLHTKEELPHKCHLCGQAEFSSEKSLEAHLHKHPQCKVCGKYKPNPAELSRHMTSHSEKRDYKCPICDHPFKRESDRKHHRKNSKNCIALQSKLRDTQDPQDPQSRQARMRRLPTAVPEPRDARQHLGRAHPIQDDKTCGCAKVFATTRGLSVHRGR